MMINVYMLEPEYIRDPQYHEWLYRHLSTSDIDNYDLVIIPGLYKLMDMFKDCAICDNITNRNDDKLASLSDVCRFGMGLCDNRSMVVGIGITDFIMSMRDGDRHMFSNMDFIVEKYNLPRYEITKHIMDMIRCNTDESEIILFCDLMYPDFCITHAVIDIIDLMCESFGDFELINVTDTHQIERLFGDENVLRDR